MLPAPPPHAGASRMLPLAWMPTGRAACRTVVIVMGGGADRNLPGPAKAKLGTGGLAAGLPEGALLLACHACAKGPTA